MKPVKPVNISCICNNTKLVDIADKINTDNLPCSLSKLKMHYRCGNKCGKCIPYIKQLLKVVTNF
jgi:bacterioferritin-associated ferredoxin